MKGRIENKVKLETALKEKLKDAPEYMIRYFYYINSKTHATKRTYLYNVIRFVKYIGNGDYPDVSEFEYVDGYRIQMYISEISMNEKDGELKEMKGSSSCTIISSIKSFFDFLSIRRNGVAYVSHNLFLEEKIERPKIEEIPITYLTPEEVKKFEKQILEGAGNELSVAKQLDWKLRDLLLFRIPVVNGIRVTALSEISIKDIDFKNRKIKVTEKGNVNTEKYFDEKTEQYIKCWIKKRNELLGDTKCDYLFISNRKQRMTTRSIERVIQKYADECDFLNGKHITPHKLRSTHGTNLYHETGDLLLTSKSLTHKSVSPTRRYVAVFETEIENAVNRVANLY